ncbi:MAG: zonular occludens toxin domain-containing protein, partial [Rhodoferax sp.]
MSVYIVVGKLGGGKGKYVAGKMREAILAGRKVVTNFDLFMDQLVPESNKETPIRVPDKPTAHDLAAVGPGNPDKYNTAKNGVLVLDELGSWLNARSFQDKDRAALIDWLIHSRKYGYDCYLCVQDLDMIDKQVRKSLAQYVVKCIAAEGMKIPMIGRFLGPAGKLPRFHIALISMPDIPNLQVDREFFRNDHLQNGYDTFQVFREWARSPGDEAFKTETYGGPFSYLSAWHLKGRFS